MSFASVEVSVFAEIGKPDTEHAVEELDADAGVVLVESSAESRRPSHEQHVLPVGALDVAGPDSPSERPVVSDGDVTPIVPDRTRRKVRRATPVIDLNLQMPTIRVTSGSRVGDGPGSVGTNPPEPSPSATSRAASPRDRTRRYPLVANSRTTERAAGARQVTLFPPADAPGSTLTAAPATRPR